MALTRNPSAPTADRGDDGVVLILALILTVILAVLVIAIASYATTGLATSEVTTGRTESNASASAGMTWAIEEFAAKRFLPDTHCAVDGADLQVPAGVAPYGTVEVTCSPRDDADNYPAVSIESTATVADQTRIVTVLLQVPNDQFSAQVRTWDAD